MKFTTMTAAAMLIAFMGAIARADSEIAVAMRYLQAQGVSHAQIYLFREDGKLLQQLTHFKSGQVFSPVFSADGKTIVFKLVTEDFPESALATYDRHPIIFKLVKGKGVEYWSVEPNGGNLHKLAEAPKWYQAAMDSPYFTDEDNDSDLSTEKAAAPSQNKDTDDDALGRYTTPDGRQELVLIGNEEVSEENPEGDHFQLRDLKTAKAVELGKVPGFSEISCLLHLRGKEESVFLIDGPLRVAFFWEHLDSSDGDTAYALNLANPRLVRLSPNWAQPVPLPGEGEFLTWIEARYLPIPGSTKTANCSYIEHWDSNLKKVRYGAERAAICYGASMYRPGGKPAIITINGPNSDE